jgi:hypothetical protein
VALTVGAASVAGTVITRRAPGLRLLETPPFAFASLVSAGALLLTLPVVAGTLVLLFVDHHYGRIVFGGNEGIAGEVSWIVLQPQTYVYGIPILGLVASCSRSPPAGVSPCDRSCSAARAVRGRRGRRCGMPTLDFSGVSPLEGSPSWCSTASRRCCRSCRS